ncbi:sialate O-acetylesterase [Gabonia massiliensis]|jgi:hypothetical protein|uniref:sialate O-acetylesterase n=1 Tax=Gabonia massiliensis TaxID=1686296 RepID=UPI0006D78F5F|nr:sialate O-acetylesterase [Gabonia massiliensis]
MKKIFWIIILLILVYPSNAKIQLPSVLGSNMVLQQNAKVNLWGYASASKKVKVRTSWDDKEYSALVSSDGKWILQVNTPKAGGPYTISISDGEIPEVLSNILIGEVWLCSGQSNMEMPVKGFRGQPVDSSCDVIANASPDDNIRMITLKINSSQTPLDDCISTSWMVSDPQSVADFSATAYFFASYLQKVLKVPVGVICSSWGGSKIESWVNKEVYEKQFPEISLDVLKKDMREIKRPKDEPTLLYNAMINPIKNFAIKGAIWYQGESNLNNPDVYKRLFPAMVASWRKEWKQGEFPFYYVQIAPYDYGRKNADKTEAAEIRQVQLECMDLIPNSGMVVTSDVGNRTCVHPSAKSLVGKRLALWALAKTYQKKGIPFSGPLYKSFTVNGEKLIVDFRYSEMGMTTYDQEITGFEVAGKDGIFYPAKAAFFDNKTKIVLTSEQVPEPVAVRYGFRNYMPLNLFSNFGLPASPFKSE